MNASSRRRTGEANPLGIAGSCAGGSTGRREAKRSGSAPLIPAFRPSGCEDAIATQGYPGAMAKSHPVEHDSLQDAFVLGGIATILAVALAVSMVVLWRRGRRAGRSVSAIGVALAFSVLIAGASTGWLAYQRHEKCDRTVARKLCESPVDWLRSR